MTFSSFKKDSIANYVNDVGTVYDPTTAGRPSLSGRLTTHELEALYIQNDLARRIVDEVVDDSFRTGLPVLNYKGTQEKVQLNVEETAYITELLRENSVNSRLYGGGHILIITQGNEDLSKPLDWENPPPFENAVTLDRFEVTPFTWGEDPRKPRFREPVIYQISPSAPGAFDTAFPRVHYTRLLSQRGARVPLRIRQYLSDYDDSVLQQVWNCLRNFYQSEQGMVNVINRFETATISIAGLSAVQSQEGQAELVQERMELMHKSLSILNAALIDADAGEAYERRFATVTGLDTLWDRLATSVAKAARMSKSQLFGEGSSGIRGENEAGDKGWRKQIHEYRQDVLPIICKLVQMIKGQPVEPIFDKNGTPVWGFAESPKPVDEARIGEMDSRRVTSLLDKGIISANEARQLLAGEAIDWGAPAPTPPGAEPEVSLDSSDLNEDSKPPEGAREAAQQGLDYRSEYGRGGTRTGIARARDIANGRNLPPETIRRMKAFFDRHEKNRVPPSKKTEPDGGPTNGWIAWLLWGGDAGRSWAEKMVRQMERDE